MGMTLLCILTIWLSKQYWRLQALMVNMQDRGQNYSEQVSRVLRSRTEQDRIINMQMLYHEAPYHKQVLMLTQVLCVMLFKVMTTN